MPLRRLTARERSRRRNHALGALLAFVAGSTDVCGYLQLNAYTSHVTGATASVARGLAGMGTLRVPVVIAVSFVGGAALSSIVSQWLQRRAWESEYALPVLLEAMLLAAVWAVAGPAHRLACLALLAGAMGLQNAIFTRLSNREIRTTHVTAMMTDIGIQLGRAAYVNRRAGVPPVRVDREHLALLAKLVGSFFAGGVVGAFATPHMGFALLLPLAAVLALISVAPLVADVRYKE